MTPRARFESVTVASLPSPIVSRRHILRRFLPVPAVGLAIVLSGCGGHATLVRTMDVVHLSTGDAIQPEMVRVHKDDNVVLNVGNDTSVTQGFSIEGYGIHDTVDPGSPIKVKFKAGKPGTFKIFSQLAPTNQIATLVVE